LFVVSFRGAWNFRPARFTIYHNLMNSTLLNEATKLSIPERIELVEAIWDSVAAGIDALPVSEEHRLELDRRLADLEADPEAGDPWPEVRRRLERGR